VADVCFSGGALGIVTALLTAVVGAMSMLFRLLMASKDQQIKALTELASRSTDISGRVLKSTERER
jgi:hypothetical protein